MFVALKRAWTRTSTLQPTGRSALLRFALFPDWRYSPKNIMRASGLILRKGNRNSLFQFRYSFFGFCFRAVSI